MLRIYITIALSIFLLSCAQATMIQNIAESGQSVINAERPIARYPETNGVILMSMTQSPPQSALEVPQTPDPGDAYAWVFNARNVVSGREYQLAGGARSLDRTATEELLADQDIENGRVKGHVIAHSLPPGDYVITNYDVRYLTANQYFLTDQQWTVDVDFAIPFNVDEKGVHYLGEVTCVPIESRNLIGLDTPDGWLFEISDQLQRDEPVLREKFEDIAWERLKNDTLSNGAVPKSTITFKSEAIDQRTADAGDPAAAPSSENTNEEESAAKSNTFGAPNTAFRPNPRRWRPLDGNAQPRLRTR